MYGLLIKRYWKWIAAICLVLGIWILAEPFMPGQQKEQVSQAEWNTYVSGILSQDENVSGVSIFGDSDSYNIRKIHKTAMIYEKLEDVVIKPDKQDGADKLLSDFYYYIFMLLFLGFEVIVLVADKDRGYDSLIQTFRYGNQPYRRKKLCFLCGTMFVVFWIVSLVRLGISVGKYGFLGDVSVQSAPSFAHAWFLLSVYEMYVVQLLWRSIWIFIIGIVAGVCCCFVSRVWKGIFFGSIVVFGVIAFWLSDPGNSLGPLFQISSAYFQELYFMPVGRTPVDQMFASVLIGVVFAVLAYILLYKFGDHANQYLRGRGKVGRKKNVRVYRSLYYEWKKIWIQSGAVFLLLTAFGFQIFHYGTKEETVTRAEMYYRQYMEYLEGPYQKEKAVYLKKEGEKYQQMRERLEELDKKFLEEGLNAEETSEQQVLGKNLEGEWGYQEAVKRAEHVKKREHAIFFDDYALQKFFLQTDRHTVLDLGIVCILAVTYGCLMCYIERTYEMQNFLPTFPGYKKSKRNKRILSAGYACILACIAVLPRFVFLGVQFGYSKLNASSESVEYLSFVDMPIYLVLILLFGIVWACLFGMIEVAAEVSERR